MTKKEILECRVNSLGLSDLMKKSMWKEIDDYAEEVAEAKADQHETIVMRKDQAIDKLRGQLQNCVNHLHNAKRKLGSRYDFDEAIDHANKALYDTLDA